MDFVVVANAWRAGRENPTSKHQIALALAATGHRVLWLEGAGMRAPSVGSSSDLRRSVGRLAAACRGAVRVHAGQGNGGVWVRAPLLIPLPSVAWVRELNGWLYGWTARRWARRLEFVDPVLVNYVPVLARCMKGWPGLIVYHCVDRWDAFEMYDSRLMAHMDARCCRSASLVIASAQELVTRCRGKNENTHLVLHGVDHAHFATALSPLARPHELPAGPVVGFFGLLSEWLDQDLVVELARRLPGAAIVMIGTADVSVDRLRDVPNIHLLGPRAFRDLPRYVAHFDVGIIPFVVSELTRAVNPIKLREMLAAGCPVVSTDLPEVARCADDGESPASLRCSVAGSREEFIARVKARIGRPASVQERQAISAGVKGETWAAKVHEIVDLVSNARQALPALATRCAWSARGTKNKEPRTRNHEHTILR